MKKSNIIVYAVFGLLSAAFLGLWYYLGLNYVDEPLDLVLSSIWWVMIAAAIITIMKVEKDRKERVRTIYVSDKEIFNMEAGRVKLDESNQLTDVISSTLRDLKYGFTKNELPGKNEFEPRLMVRTLKIKNDIWKGAVIDPRTLSLIHI